MENKKPCTGFLKLTIVLVAISGIGLVNGLQAQTGNISGVWILKVKTDQGNGKPRFILKQENDTLITGNYKGDFGEAPVIGTVHGNSFNFKYTIRAVTVSYVGTYTKNRMEGKSIYGTLGEGHFTGKRKKK